MEPNDQINPPVDLAKEIESLRAELADLQSRRAGLQKSVDKREETIKALQDELMGTKGVIEQLRSVFAPGQPEADPLVAVTSSIGELKKEIESERELRRKSERMAQQAALESRKATLALQVDTKLGSLLQYIPTQEDETKQREEITKFLQSISAVAQIPASPPSTPKAALPGANGSQESLWDAWAKSVGTSNEPEAMQRYLSSIQSSQW